MSSGARSLFMQRDHRQMNVATKLTPKIDKNRISMSPSGS